MQLNIRWINELAPNECGTPLYSVIKIGFRETKALWANGAKETETHLIPRMKWAKSLVQHIDLSGFLGLQVILG